MSFQKTVLSTERPNKTGQRPNERTFVSVFSKNVRLMGPITDLCSVEFMFAIFHVITRSYKHRPISGRFARGGILQYIPVKKLITPDSYRMSFRRVLSRVAVASGVTATSAIIATKRNISARDYQKNDTFIDHKYDLDWDKLPKHNGYEFFFKNITFLF